jgi:hypothetical protein
MAVVETLAQRAPRTDVESTLDDFDRMWQAADNTPFLDDDASPDDEEDDEIRTSIAALSDAMGNINQVGPGGPIKAPLRFLGGAGGKWASVRIYADSLKLDHALVGQLKGILLNYPGDVPIRLTLAYRKREVPLSIDRFAVSESPALLVELRELFGELGVEVVKAPEPEPSDEPPF